MVLPDGETLSTNAEDLVDTLEEQKIFLNKESTDLSNASAETSKIRNRDAHRGIPGQMRNLKLRLMAAVTRWSGLAIPYPVTDGRLSLSTSRKLPMMSPMPVHPGQ